MSRFVEIFVAVPQEYMGIVIGARGRNINQIKRETDTRIDSCNGDKLGRESGFRVTGSAAGCEAARQALRFCVVSMIIIGISLFDREVIYMASSI
jgi:predicted PilT family ATPase